MKHLIRKWLGINSDRSWLLGELRSTESRLTERIHKAEAQPALESEIVKIEQHFSKEIADIRERLEAPRRVSSHRPFTMMRALAEEGAKAQRNAPR